MISNYQNFIVVGFARCCLWLTATLINTARKQRGDTDRKRERETERERERKGAGEKPTLMACPYIFLYTHIFN